MLTLFTANQLTQLISIYRGGEPICCEKREHHYLQGGSAYSQNMAIYELRMWILTISFFAVSAYSLWKSLASLSTRRAGLQCRLLKRRWLRGRSFCCQFLRWSFLTTRSVWSQLATIYWGSIPSLWPLSLLHVFIGRTNQFATAMSPMFWMLKIEDTVLIQHLAPAGLVVYDSCPPSSSSS